jgi:hypothetical protein
VTKSPPNAQNTNAIITKRQKSSSAEQAARAMVKRGPGANACRQIAPPQPQSTKTLPDPTNAGTACTPVYPPSARRGWQVLASNRRDFQGLGERSMAKSLREMDTTRLNFQASRGAAWRLNVAKCCRLERRGPRCCHRVGARFRRYVSK